MFVTLLVMSMNEKTNALLFTVKRPNIVFAKGEGMYLWDETGKKYLDFIAGWAVNTLGHCPKVLVDCITEQAKTCINASPAFYNTAQLAYAQALTAAAGLEKVFFCSTGAEANESAIKCARKWGSVHKNGAYKIITMERGFHGRTLATMSATGKEAFKPMFEPKVEGFIHVPFNDIDAVKNASTDDVCAVLLELVQGEGGVHPADQDYISQLADWCKAKNILLMIDEVQTCLGRTGKLFAFEHYGIKPDIVSCGKGMGSGYPLAAMLAQRHCDVFEPGEQGGTYTGQPLGMAVGLTVLNEVQKPGFLDQVNRSSEYLIAELKKRQAKGLENIRGKGLLIGCDLPGKDAGKIAEHCMENGLLLNACGPETLRFIPALITTTDDIDNALSILDSALDATS